MKTIPLYQVDAFTDRLFSGNPAAVCPLEEALSEEQMQSIAMENNLSETAFIDLSESPFRIRWFTPLAEIDLCGHATLASSRILFDEYLGSDTREIDFSSNSCLLQALKRGEQIFLDFPSDQPVEVDAKSTTVSLIEQIIGLDPVAVLKGRDDYMAVVGSEEQVLSVVPDIGLLEELPSRGLIVTSKGSKSDFVSRCFFPKLGEDPVTGSAHTVMTPYWAKELGKKSMIASQLSKRGGTLNCELNGDRALIGGSSIRYLDGRLYL